MISPSSQFNLSVLFPSDKTANFLPPSKEIAPTEPTFDLELYRNKKARIWIMQIKININIDRGKLIIWHLYYIDKFKTVTITEISKKLSIGMV